MKCKQLELLKVANLSIITDEVYKQKKLRSTQILT